MCKLVYNFAHSYWVVSEVLVGFVVIDIRTLLQLHGSVISKVTSHTVDILICQRVLQVLM